MTFIKYLITLAVSDIAIILATVFTIPISLIIIDGIGGMLGFSDDANISNDHKSPLNRIVRELWFYIGLAVAVVLFIYIFGLWQSFHYFMYSTYCDKNPVSAKWLYFLVTFSFAMFVPLAIANNRNAITGEKQPIGIRLIIEMMGAGLFILPFFYPKPIHYLYEWILNPVINFIF